MKISFYLIAIAGIVGGLVSKAQTVSVAPTRPTAQPVALNKSVANPRVFTPIVGRVASPDGAIPAVSVPVNSRLGATTVVSASSPAVGSSAGVDVAANVVIPTAAPVTGVRQSFTPVLGSTQDVQNRDFFNQALINNRDTLNANLARNQSAVAGSSLGQPSPFSSAAGGIALTNSLLFQNVTTGTSVISNVQPSGTTTPINSQHSSPSVVATNVITSGSQLPGFGR